MHPEDEPGVVQIEQGLARVGAEREHGVAEKLTWVSAQTEASAEPAFEAKVEFADTAGFEYEHVVDVGVNRMAACEALYEAAPAAEVAEGVHE